MVAMPAVSIASSDKPQKPVKMSKTSKPRDLYRFICALSGACERDANVLRDGQLVDFLEMQAKEILRARRQNRSQSMGSSSSSVSFSSSSSTVRLASSPVLTPLAPPSSGKISKRRKLPADYGKTDSHSYGYDKSPVFVASGPSSSQRYDLEADKASLYMARGDGSASLIPSVKISKIERRDANHKSLSPYTAPRSGSSHDLVVNSVSLADQTSPMEHLSLTKPSSSSPTRPSRESLDFGASMVSTVSSSSMPHYDLSDVEDSLGSLSYTPRSARYTSAVNTYDYEDYGSNQSSDANDSQLHMSELDRSRRKDSCYSESSTTSSYDRATPKKLRFEMDALALYEKEESMHMSSASSYKNVESGLVDTLQSQVDLLLSENVKALTENARLTEISQMSACEAEDLAAEKRRIAEQIKQQSEQLVDMESKFLESQKRADAQEDIRREAEVAFQAELDAKAKIVAELQQQMQIKDEEISRLNKRVEDISGLFASKIRDQEERGLSLTGARPSLKASSSMELVVPSSNQDDEDEPELVTGLRESNMFMDMELQRMRSSLLEKDREICNLYMHLSTKKKLIEEITKKFVQHMEEAAAAAKVNAENAAPVIGSPTDGVRFDLDMFLFKNVVDKQRRMEELTAALGVMDREVESLEARVADKERENNQLRENQDFLMRSLQTVNAQVCRIQAENESLDASVQEKQSRITSLISSLEEKERHILHLDEQVDLRQMQIDSLMSGDKTAASGRRSLKNSLMKARASFSSSAVKATTTRSSLLSFSSARDGEEETDGFRRSSITSAAPQGRSSAIPMTRKSSVDASSVGRSSADWTDVRRSSIVSSQRPSTLEYRTSIVSESEFATTKRTSVFSDVFNDISAPLEDDDESVFGMSASGDEARSTRASYCASEINDDEELYNELFAKA